MHSVAERLSGWGNFPVEQCRVLQPHRVSSLRDIILKGEEGTYISRGLGRAYGDSSLNGHGGVILHTHLNHFLAFDEVRGILKCEAGVSLAEIIECLLPRGWFLPTTPGTKFVTVGGAIAADVHGKNHHADGSFGNFVVSLDLLTAAGEVVTCSPLDHTELFWATVGGMGLTGAILRARVQMVPVETAYYDVTYRRTENIDATLEQLAATNDQYRYSVAWVDCLAKGRSLGRSVLMLGNHASLEDLPLRLRKDALSPRRRRPTQIPMNLPSGLVNAWSVRLFNALYYRTHPNRRQFVDYNTFFYPLDSLLDWNRIYGRSGFFQYQVLFPHRTSRQGLAEMLSQIADSGLGPFLAVLKISGGGTPSPLSFLYAGHTLALDFPVSAASLELVRNKLDPLLLKHGGRLYLAKDATTSAESFAEMYPRLLDFQRIKQQIDPHSRFVSSQAHRLGIVAAS
jgi:FAD/FMN-containing dehydrogenase